MSSPERIPSAPHSVDVRGVEVFRWLPHRLSALPEYQPENFGDALAAELVRGIVARNPALRPQRRSHRLLSIGSVLHFGRPHDVVWGAGVNGKVEGARVGSSQLDVRAVRGPLTRDLLLQRGVPTPEVFGDPGLLVPTVFPFTRDWAQRKRRALAVVPNFNDARHYAAHPDFVNPLAPLWDVIRRIAESEFVIASSLHGIVIAEALGVPVRPLVSPSESAFKYDDYAAGTGREPLPASETIEHALRSGPIAPLEWNPDALLEAFPTDLWRTIQHSHAIIAGADAEALAATLANIAEVAGPADEVLIGLSTDAPGVAEQARAAAEQDPRIRLRSVATLACSGTPWDFMFDWSRGTTATLLTAGSSYCNGFFERARASLESSRAVGVFGRVQAFGNGPDDDPWRTAPVFDAGAEITLAEHPELLALQGLAGAVLSTSRIDEHARLGRGELPLLGVLSQCLERGTPLIIEPGLAAVFARPEPVELETPGLFNTLDRYADALTEVPEAARARVSDAALVSASRAIESCPAAPTSQDVAEASLRLLRAARPTAVFEADRALPLISAAFGLGPLAAGAPSADAVAVLSGVSESLTQEGPESAWVARALVAGIPRLLAVAVPEQLEPLRRAAIALGQHAVSDDVPPSAVATTVAAAHEGNGVSFALRAIADDAVEIEHAVPTGLGFLITGTMPRVFEGRRLQVWVSDAAAGSARVGSLTPGKPLDTRLTFAGHVRHAFAPAGKLELRAPGSAHGTGMTTARAPMRKMLQQLLRPVEIPLDGGTALLVRRPSPLSVVRARLNH